MQSSRGSTAPTEYRADTGDLGVFVERGRRLGQQLSELVERLGAARAACRSAIGDGGPEPRGAAHLRRLAEAVGRTDGFVAAVRADLLADGRVDRPWPPALDRAIVGVRLPPPDDALRNRLLAAIEAGLDPEAAGIDPAYFPAPVLHHRSLTGRLAEAEAARDAADGLPLIWWDGDHEAVDELDRVLDRLRSEREALAEHGIAPDGSIDPVDAVALVAEATGGGGWEGRWYGARYAEHHDRRVGDRGFLGLDQPRLRDPGGFGSELDHIAERVAGDGAVALAFYNRIGVARAADLVTLAVGDDRRGPAVVGLGRGLARASRAMSPAGEPLLAFGGGDLVRRPLPSTASGVVAYSPVLLFVDGRFEDRFLAQATVAALELADGADPRGLQTHRGSEDIGSVIPVEVSLDGGEDPRNILLARAAERRSAARAVVDELWGRHRSLEPLLRPGVAFEPAAGWDRSGGWLDTLRALDNVEGPERSSLSPRAYPALTVASPVTAFLDAAAGDGEAAGRVLASTARLSGDGPVFGDPGTAAGVDLILARHLALVVDDADLAAVGILPSGLRDGAGPAIGPPEWRAVYREVLRAGRGQALAAGADRMLARAIEGSVDGEGRFDPGPVRPFAHLAARTEAESTEALLAHAAALDADARETNRRVGATVGLAIGAAGWVPPVAVGAWLAGGVWSYAFGGYPTDRELEELRQRWVDAYYGRDPSRWERLVADTSLARRAGSDGTGRVEVELPGGRTEVTYRLAPGPEVPAEWADPSTGGWRPLPEPGDEGFEDLFPSYDPSLHAQVVASVESVDRDLHDARVLVGRRLGRAPDVGDGSGPAPGGPVGGGGPDGPAWTDRWLGVP